MRQLLEAAIDNYLGWQKFLGGLTPSESANAELERKFNHLLAESQQAQVDLRQLIKDANDRISQQAIWIDRKLAAIKTALNTAIKKQPSQFSDSEAEFLRKMARSMGAVEPVTECADDFCPMPTKAEIKERLEEAGNLEVSEFKPEPAIDEQFEQAKKKLEVAKAELEAGAAIDLNQLNRQQLGKLLTQYKIPHRNPEGKVWRVDEMRQMLAEKMPSTETAIAQTVTKKRGRPAKSKAA